MWNQDVQGVGLVEQGSSYTRSGNIGDDGPASTLPVRVFALTDSVQ